jgi:hypothetical protein
MSIEDMKAAQAADYARPERQKELQELHDDVQELLFGHNVLVLDSEYWEPVIAEMAESINEGNYTAVFSEFSAVKREDQDRFLKEVRQRTGKDVLLVLLGEAYVEGSSTVTARTDLSGNTYQLRNNNAGERFEKLTNYPTDSYLRKKLATFGREIRIERHKYYWFVNCRLK